MKKRSSEWELKTSDRKKRVETVRRLSAQGMSVAEISRQTGIKYNTAYYMLYPEKRSAYKQRSMEKSRKTSGVDEGKVGQSGWNADRHACRSCRYRARPEQVNRCDYIEHARHSRGCAVEDCDRYVRGRRLKLMHTTGYKSKI